MSQKRKKIGLALGGGGPRGLAHIGILKVLEKNNIPIDYIAGTSAGALIGGGYAFDKDIKRLEKTVIDVNWRKFFSLVDPSLKHGLIKGKKVKEFIEQHVGEVNFEDLKIPFWAIATDINTGERIFLKQGKLSSAIRASISIPLVFRPTKIDGRVLVDGGLSMPVPVQAVKEMGADIVIGVNLSSKKVIEKINKYNLASIAENSIFILSYYLSLWNSNKADLLISPKLGRVGWKKFIEPHSVILKGEKAAQEKIEEIKKLIE